MRNFKSEIFLFARLDTVSYAPLHLLLFQALTIQLFPIRTAYQRFHPTHIFSYHTKCRFKTKVFLRRRRVWRHYGGERQNFAIKLTKRHIFQSGLTNPDCGKMDVDRWSALLTETTGAMYVRLWGPKRMKLLHWAICDEPAYKWYFFSVLRDTEKWDSFCEWKW